MAEQFIQSQELLIPFNIDGHVVYFKMICPKCGSTFFIMADDHQTIACDKEKCDAVPLVVPKGLDSFYGMWKI